MSMSARLDAVGKSLATVATEIVEVQARVAAVTARTSNASTKKANLGKQPPAARAVFVYGTLRADTPHGDPYGLLMDVDHPCVWQ